MVRTIGGMRIVDMSSRFRTVSAHSRRRIVRHDPSRASGRLAVVGPNAHDLEVDLLERGSALADLEDVGPRKHERSHDRGRRRGRLGGVTMSRCSTTSTPVTPGTARAAATMAGSALPRA